MNENQLISPERIREHYREVLETNDRQRLCLNPSFPDSELPAELAWHSLSILEPLLYCSPSGCDRILDIGCGAGADCYLAAHRGGEGVTVIGMDMLGELIHRATELKERHGYQNVEFICASPPPLEMPSESFDLVIMNYSFHLFSEKKELLAEIARVLKKNGGLVIADSFTPRSLAPGTGIDEWLMHAGPAASVSDFEAMAASAGIEVTRFVPERSLQMPPEEVVGYMICRKA